MAAAAALHHDHSRMQELMEKAYAVEIIRCESEDCCKPTFLYCDGCSKYLCYDHTRCSCSEPPAQEEQTAPLPQCSVSACDNTILVRCDKEDCDAFVCCDHMGCPCKRRMPTPEAERLANSEVYAILDLEWWDELHFDVHDATQVNMQADHKRECHAKLHALAGYTGESQLGFEPGARNIREATRRLRKLALRVHPDKNKGCQDAAEAFKRVAEAMEQLHIMAQLHCQP